MNLPDHKCGLYLTHNDHLCDYMTAAEQIAYWGRRVGCGPDWPNDDTAKQRAIETGEIWELRWYPRTPVSFNHIAAPTLDELLAFAATYP